MAKSTPSIKAAFGISFLSLAISSTHASVLLPRGPQTNATCLNNYSWMENESGLSSCLVAAYVMTACGTTNFAVLALQDGNHYDQPGVKGDEVNSCSCSWAGYNMLMACTACQGFDDSIFGWAPWKQNCDEKYLSNTTYFPFAEDFVIGTTLPYWAGQNPLSWGGGRFDAVAARSLYEEGS
ncbi:hypothetical protein BDZ89DRAFT_625915 [Hymenopellis radicata]|nr:hypothetical protein BDZ89DRAFT_625915 [Hymenopellis radicata]